MRADEIQKRLASFHIRGLDIELLENTCREEKKFEHMWLEINVFNEKGELVGDFIPDQNFTASWNPVQDDLNIDKADWWCESRGTEYLDACIAEWQKLNKTNGLEVERTYNPETGKWEVSE